jgi:hypothetical protein
MFFCLGFYVVAPNHETQWADCDVCGSPGPVGERCQQTVIPVRRSEDANT